MTCTPVNDGNLAFIVSSPRSGSTLLTRILNGHSKISAPFEIGVPKFFIGDIKESDVLHKTVQICKKYELDTRRAVEEPDYYLGSILHKEGKKMLIVKDPRHSIMLPKIYAYFGDAKIIVLTRDARAVCQSKMFNKNYKVALHRWVQYYKQILQFKEMFSNVHFVKYEDITVEPESTVSELCHFLECEFEPEMLEYWDKPHADDDMKLWAGGFAPKDHPRQERLAKAKKIEKNVLTEFPDEVMAIYNKSAELRRLSSQFGYD